MSQPTQPKPLMMTDDDMTINLREEIEIERGNRSHGNSSIGVPLSEKIVIASLARQLPSAQCVADDGHCENPSSRTWPARHRVAQTLDSTGPAILALRLLGGSTWGEETARRAPGIGQVPGLRGGWREQRIE